MTISAVGSVLRDSTKRPATLGEILAVGADRSAGPDGCWNWRGKLSDGGYARLSYGGQRTVAHRWAWIEAHGRQPAPDQVVRHACDNRACVNPSHLLVGTQRDNVNDMMTRGRWGGAIGEANPKAKLTESQVREIRTRAASGANKTQLARDFAVSPTLVRSIVSRKVWAWLS